MADAGSGWCTTSGPTPRKEPPAHTMTGDGSDLYAVLGITSQATQEEIRRAYRNLLRHNHPDTRLPGGPSDDTTSSNTLQQALLAYTVLGDPTRRAEYDHRTTRHRTGTPIVVRTVSRPPPGPREQAPIQAGPVRWHRSQ